MSGFDDWICDNEGDIYEKFKNKYISRIRDEYNTKYKESYPDFEEFLDDEKCYITDTMLEREWIDFVNEEHVSSISGQADRLFEQEKDRIIEEQNDK